MALQGTLDTFALPDVLRLLAATGKTGRLRITGDRGSGAVWVESGSVVDVDLGGGESPATPALALFELLRLEEGSFSFDVDVVHDDPAPPQDLEALLGEAGALLEEWRAIAAVVPSVDAWVSLRPRLAGPQVTLDQDRWTTLLAVGGGATVAAVGATLGLGDLNVCRAVKDLVEAGVAEIDDEPPAGLALTGAAAPVSYPTSQPVSEPFPVREPAPVADSRPAPAVPPPAAAPPAAAPPAAPSPFDLTDAGPGAEAASDPRIDIATIAPPAAGTVTDLSGGAVSDLDAQLAHLSPRAAEAVRAVATATTDAERDAALAAAQSAAAEDDDGVNRGLLLKFLSSVKS